MLRWKLASILCEMARRDPSRCNWCRGRHGGCNYCPLVPENEAEMLEMLEEKLESGEAHFFIFTDGHRIPVPHECVTLRLPKTPSNGAKPKCRHEFRFEVGKAHRKFCIHCKAVMVFRFDAADPGRNGVWVFEEIVRLFGSTLETQPEGLNSGMKRRYIKPKAVNAPEINAAPIETTQAETTVAKPKKARKNRLTVKR